MTENEPEVTQPVTEKKKKKQRKSKKKFFQRRGAWYLIGFVFALLIVIIGALLGIPRGINDRVQLAEAQAAPKIQAQVDAAEQDIEDGRYEVAKTRLDWILDEMSPYLTEAEMDEVGQLYSQTLLMISSKGTPTPAPSPTPTALAYTPTPDLRGEEDLFNTAQQLIAAESWDEAVQTLEALREKDINFRSVEVDGMFYIALRNRGVDKIIIEGSLEPGMYDLSLAERFAPLDSTADGIRTYARMYLTGASYWGVDWSQVTYYFGQLYTALPNLRDGTGMTATERYRQGLLNYGTQLANAEKYCQAQEYFNKAMGIAADPEAQPTAQWVADKCWQQQNPPTEAPPEVTPTPTGAPTEAPTDAPTDEPTTEP